MTALEMSFDVAWRCGLAMAGLTALAWLFAKYSTKP